MSTEKFYIDYKNNILIAKNGMFKLYLQKEDVIYNEQTYD
jgi:hypothetical protein